MTYYEYVPASPLDFTHPFMTISQMKKMITRNCEKPRDFFLYGDSSDELIEDLDKQINEVFPNGIDESDLRMPVLVFPIPTGEMWEPVKYCFIVKKEENGITYIYSPIKIPYLENNVGFLQKKDNAI
ncbi:hypothetical protein DKB98_05570 [Enterococcus faecalis]|uniref:hypothetical protein n=1 Tax=Enterococcus faecalis TaxID=1351 RepID=UPI000D67C7C3|nr:hypothetical protein [Enterococcus faecalis]PWI83051.1 hypothetical protein DKC02_04120 [Enterococcus faecalis]PWI85419.1 hypothetical protein DKC03_12260 [Enterococcus faecalis]PWI87822.1 hypothetical protein DKB98_05570 [Enterococcus faecalis]